MARIATGISDLNNEISSNEFVIVGITASWCSQCKMIKPMMNGIEEEYKEKVKFIEIDQDKNPEISSKYNVISLPTFLFSSCCNPALPYIISSFTKSSSWEEGSFVPCSNGPWHWLCPCHWPVYSQGRAGSTFMKASAWGTPSLLPHASARLLAILFRRSPTWLL